MKLFRNASMLTACTAAIGWFMLNDLSFIGLLPLIPLGLVYCCLIRKGYHCKWLNGILCLISLFLTAATVSQGIFGGRGFWLLIFLLIALGILGWGAPRRELMRISGWWTMGFVLIFFVMLIATFLGVREINDVPAFGDWKKYLIFYVLAFAEPLSLGRDYKTAPLILGLFLLPFGAAAYYALGSGAFSMAEFPYLSVWSGVDVSAFHHTEGLILSLYFGMGGLRLAHYGAECKKSACKISAYML